VPDPLLRLPCPLLLLLLCLLLLCLLLLSVLQYYLSLAEVEKEESY
jgi:hypothetical protein